MEYSIDYAIERIEKQYRRFALYRARRDCGNRVFFEAEVHLWRWAIFITCTKQTRRMSHGQGSISGESIPRTTGIDN